MSEAAGRLNPSDMTSEQSAIFGARCGPQLSLLLHALSTDRVLAAGDRNLQFRVRVHAGDLRFQSRERDEVAIEAEYNLVTIQQMREGVRFGLFAAVGESIEQPGNLLVDGNLVLARLSIRIGTC